jgi:hypothetical protein
LRAAAARRFTPRGKALRRRRARMVLRPLVDVRFQVLFHLRLTGLLFTFRSRYFCAIGRPGVLSLGRWASRFQVGFHVSGPTWVVVNREPAPFAYGPITLCGAPFQVLLLGGAFVTLPQGPVPLRRQHPQPRTRNAQGLTRVRFRLFPFRSPLLRESSFLSSPAGTEMCQFPAFASAPYVFRCG